MTGNAIRFNGFTPWRSASRSSRRMGGGVASVLLRRSKACARDPTSSARTEVIGRGFHDAMRGASRNLLTTNSRSDLVSSRPGLLPHLGRRLRIREVGLVEVAVTNSLTGNFSATNDARGRFDVQLELISQNTRFFPGREEIMLVRRALLVLTFLFSALSTTAQPITINGSPLTIVVGPDTAMQVHNSNVPGNGQFFPPTSNPGDAGVFVAIGTTVYGPGFLTGFNVTPLTPISLDSSGNGTPSNPYKVVVVADAGSALELTESLTYVNGDTTVGINLSFNAPPIGAPEGGLAFSAFIAGDIFLANNDSGFNFATPFTEAGSHAADLNCIEIPQYSIFFIGTTPADRYSANLYTQVWTEVSAGDLSDSSSNTCIDVGAALQWNRTYLGQTISIDTGVTFSGSICQPIDLQPSSLDPASVGTTYAETITASGGTAPYQFTHTGNLPPGLTLSTDGVVSGVPTLRGAFPFSVTAMDAAGCASPPTRYILLVSCPTITVTPESLPSGAVGFSYGPIQIDAVGAVPPNHFFVSSGSFLPDSRSWHCRIRPRRRRSWALRR